MMLPRNLIPAAVFGLGLAGCALAAEPLSGEWHVEDIGGAGVVDASTVTLDFFEPGRLAGSGGCNRYTTSLEGEGFGIGPVGATMMMCDEALMQQEQRFFAALETASRYELDETGALLLFAGDEAAPVIVARQH